MGVGCPSKGTPLPFWCSVRFPLIPLEFNAHRRKAAKIDTLLVFDVAMKQRAGVVAI